MGIGILSGIRGKANYYPMDGAMAFQVGQAVAHLMKKKDQSPRIVVGRDTRISGFMLIAILALYFTCGQTFDMITLMHTAPTALNGVLWWGMSAVKVIWILLFVGFAIKVPVFPFHTWLPLAHVEAPTAISVILAGVLLKMGIYGMLRVNYSMLPGFDPIPFFNGQIFNLAADRGR